MVKAKHFSMSGNYCTKLIILHHFLSCHTKWVHPQNNSVLTAKWKIMLLLLNNTFILTSWRKLHKKTKPETRHELYNLTSRALHAARGLHSRGSPAGTVGPDQISCDTGLNSRIKRWGNSGVIWTGAGGLTISRSRRPFRTAYLRFILIDHVYSLHSGLLCMRCTCSEQAVPVVNIRDVSSQYSGSVSAPIRSFSADRVSERRDRSKSDIVHILFCVIVKPRESTKAL